VNAKNEHGATALHLVAETGYASYSNTNVDLIKLLLARGADINARTRVGYSALHYALLGNNTDAARYLIEKGINIDFRGLIKRTALHTALYKKNAKIAKLLIERGTKFKLRDENGNTALDIAVSNNLIKVAELLLAKDANPNNRSNNGNSTLYKAVATKLPAMVSLLLKKGAKPNLKISYSHLHLLRKAAGDGGLAMVKILLPLYKSRADRNFAVHNAARHGRVEVIRLLLKSNADVNSHDGTQSMLHMAVSEGYFKLVRLLVNSGIELNSQDYTGNSALHDLVVKNLSFISLYEFEKNKAELINQHFGNKGVYWQLPKLSAFKQKEQEHLVKRDLIISYLLIKGVDVNLTDSQGRTALHYSVINNNKILSALLLAFGSNPNIQDHITEIRSSTCGFTALHYAAMNANLGLVKLLIKHKADPNIPDRDKAVALNYVKESQSPVLYRFLKLHTTVDTTQNQHMRSHAVFCALGNNVDVLSRKLLAQLKNTHVRDYRGDTILHVAVKSGNLVMLKNVLDKKVDVNAVNYHGRTALQMVLTENSNTNKSGFLEKAARLLMQHKANIDIRDDSGDTALHIAVKANRISVVKLILEFKPTIKIKNFRRNTALMLAIKLNKPGLIALLK